MISHSSVMEGVILAPFTTYKVGGPARWFVEPNDLEELRSILEVTPPAVDVWVLGRGSNVVISDEGFDGLVIRLGQGFCASDVRGDGSVVAGGGLALPVLARAAVDAGRGGLEFYVGIPGSVGGAVRMNAGGHGSDTASVLTSARILRLSDRVVDSVPVGDLAFSYRSSVLSDDDIVVQATFDTYGIDPEVGREELREITRWRKANQPGGTLNAGSVFKNPEGDSAGAIIDRLGLKGTVLGTVTVSDVHANWLVASSDATAGDIHRFVQTIRRIVFERSGIELEPEIRFIGRFADDEVAP
ncbi:MAG TPA: UDP-N-acetylmuramate dehydrogenase [Acidimicrobiia bacterium]|nr:UDP-N-acetylmuramate dehydrogenase [Acidimicrobiia bacterium]